VVSQTGFCEPQDLRDSLVIDPRLTLAVTRVMKPGLFGASIRCSHPRDFADLSVKTELT